MWSKQVTCMHCKIERVGKDGDVLPVPPALEGYVENAIPFKLGWKTQKATRCTI